MEIDEAREAAVDFFDAVTQDAFDNVDLDQIQKAFSCDLEDAMAILFEMGMATPVYEWHGDDCACGDDDQMVVPGDPDPTPLAWIVGEYTACSDSDGTYLCSMEMDHDGLHIAGDGTEVCAVWL